MNKWLLFLLPVYGWSQSFPGAPGSIGSTAIPKDSSCFIAWATGIQLSRGFLDINDTTQTYDNSNRASFGLPEYALGPAEGDLTTVVSLGDHGEAILTFDRFISDGPGFDFAIFENGFQDNYLELGHVAVSSDGIHFFTFPSVSEIPTDQQAWNGSTTDCRYVNNLAGKYRAGFGTPFDLSELPADPQLNLHAITHVRITDVVGSISDGGTNDSQGNRINDPYPTPFASCGFDLDAVGIINYTLSTNNLAFYWNIWPNPAQEILHFQLPCESEVTITDLSGKIQLVQKIAANSVISVGNLASGTYFVGVHNDYGYSTRKLNIR